MPEFRRILGRKKLLLVLTVILVFYGIFFLFQCSEVKKITPEGDELRGYVEGYRERVNTVCDNAAEMQENPLFRDKNSFVYRNLIRTGNDFERLKEIRPVIGENRGILMVLEFPMTDILLLLAGVYIVLCFLSERQKGLHLLVRSTYYGRLRLSLWRLGVLFSGLVIAAALLFTTSMLLSNVMYPGAKLSRPLQSLPEFGEVISHLTIGEYLVLFALRRVFACLVLCLALWLCMAVFRTGASVLCFTLFFLGEFLCYHFIAPTERIGVLRYCNLYTYLFYGTEYAKYYNLNLFKRPVAIEAAAEGSLVILAVLLSAVCLYRFAKQYPDRTGGGSKLFERAERFLSRWKPQPSLTGWEIRKVFLSQKGILVIAAMLYLALSSARPTQYLDTRSKYVVHWYEEFAGEVNEEKIAEIEAEMEKMEEYKANAEEQLRWWQELLNRKMVEYQQRIQELIANGQEITEKDRIDTGPAAEAIERLTERIEELTKEMQGLSIVLEQAKECDAYSKTSHLRLQLMDSTIYELLLKKDKQTILRNYLTVLLAMVVLMSGVMACEKTAHMDGVLHSLYRGRGPVFVRKLFILIGTGTVCTLSVHLIQYYEIRGRFGLEHMDYFVQSIPCMRWISVSMTIRQFFLLQYGGRCLLAVLVGGLAMFFGSRFSRVMAIAFGIFSLIVPMGLLVMYFYG